MIGVYDKYSETVENHKYIIDFLPYLQSIKAVREFVIAGDISWMNGLYYIH